MPLTLERSASTLLEKLSLALTPSSNSVLLSANTDPVKSPVNTPAASASYVISPVPTLYFRKLAFDAALIGFTTKLALTVFSTAPPVALITIVFCAWLVVPALAPIAIEFGPKFVWPALAPIAIEADPCVDLPASVPIPIALAP